VIELAMEIPRLLLDDLSPLCDFDFCLAQEVINDEEYAKYYHQAPNNTVWDGETPGQREVFMDNGFHELGRPLSSHELLDASKKINPTYVVAPDMIDDLPWTFKHYEICQKVFKDSKTTVIPVLTAAPELDQKSFIMNTQDAPILCLPFRRPRLSWLRFHADTIAKYFDRIHLLGVSELEELVAMAQLCQEIPLQVSVDTGKPVKWGLMGNRFNELTSLRHAPIHSSKMATIESITDMQRSNIYWNIAYLRRSLV
jgi:hypothetical protein